MSIIGLIVLFFTGLPVAYSDPQFLWSFNAVAILAILGTSLSLIMFNRLIQMTNAVFAASVTYLIPVVAMLWGFFDNEEINSNQIIGLILILLAIRVINLNRPLKWMSRT
jgi:drug/metabolite transporter (DMT)-like permease